MERHPNLFPDVGDRAPLLRHARVAQASSVRGRWHTTPPGRGRWFNRGGVADAAPIVSMAAHSKDQRTFIVRMLATFESNKAIVAAFVVRFPDTACTDADVIATDPRIAVVDPALHTLFYEERKRVLADPDAAIYANRQARLIVLSKQVDMYGMGRPAEQRIVFRQIAEELAFGNDAAAPASSSEVVRITRTIVDPAASS